MWIDSKYNCSEIELAAVIHLLYVCIQSQIEYALAQGLSKQNQGLPDFTSMFLMRFQFLYWLYKDQTELKVARLHKHVFKILVSLIIHSHIILVPAVPQPIKEYTFAAGGALYKVILDTALTYSAADQACRTDPDLGNDNNNLTFTAVYI